MWGPRRQHVIVAVVFDPQRGFFVSFNEKWRGYAFPMHKRRDWEADSLTALSALREAVQLPLPDATAQALGYLEYRRRSSNTGQDTWYYYHAFEVNPGVPLPGGGFAERHGFLSCDLLLAGGLVVTWSTRAIVYELMDNQVVSVAVVCRPGRAGREYLMVQNNRHDGYFFPASRRKTDAPAAVEAEEALRGDTGYTGMVSVGQVLSTEERHFSPRFGRERRFVFHLVPITLPDPSRALAALERSMRRNGARWRWVSEMELADPAAHHLSPTLTVLRPLLASLAWPEATPEIACVPGGSQDQPGPSPGGLR